MSNTEQKPIYPFRLVQALHTPVLMSDLGNRRFLEIFYLKYMGAAQYEGGSFERCLISLDEAINASRIETFEAEVDGVVIFGLFDTKFSSLEGVLAGIKSLLDGTAVLKRPSDFPPQGRPPSVAWAEINLGVFWALADFREHLPGMIQREVRYFTEPKKEVVQ